MKPDSVPHDRGPANSSHVPPLLNHHGRRVLQAILLFMAACGLLLTGYVAFLNLPWPAKLAALAATLALVAIPSLVWAKTRTNPTRNSTMGGTQVTQDGTDAQQAASDPTWARVITSWWYMGFWFPAIFVPVGFWATNADWWGSRVPAILFYRAPIFVFLTGALVFFLTNHSLEERFGVRLRGISLLRRSRMLCSGLPRPVRQRLVANLVGAAAFMPAIGWQLFGWLTASLIYQ